MVILVLVPVTDLLVQVLDVFRRYCTRYFVEPVLAQVKFMDVFETGVEAKPVGTVVQVFVQPEVPNVWVVL